MLLAHTGQFLVRTPVIPETRINSTSFSFGERFGTRHAARQKLDIKDLEYIFFFRLFLAGVILEIYQYNQIA